MGMDKSIVEKYQKLAQESIEACPVYPEGRYGGRGIVICAGGLKYFTCAWVCINMLRKMGCDLPIEVWYIGSREMDSTMIEMLKPFNVDCIDAVEMQQKYPTRRPLGGWELNPYSIIHSNFREILFLDADNVVTLNPEYLFDSLQYRETGAVFWPDYGRLAPDRDIWELCGVKYRDEPEFESGQIIIDKKRCWKELNLTMHLNEHSDMYYKHIHGDKDTYHMAWHMLDTKYSMPSRGIHALPSVMCQHDFYGNRVFQHRNMDKWNYTGVNKRIQGFMYERECLRFLEVLKSSWTGIVHEGAHTPTPNKTPEISKAEAEVAGTRFSYIREGYDHRTLRLLKTGMIGEGRADLEALWWLDTRGGVVTLYLGPAKDDPICSLKKDRHGVWRGSWLKFEQMPITLREFK